MHLSNSVEPPDNWHNSALLDGGWLLETVCVDTAEKVLPTSEERIRGLRRDADGPRKATHLRFISSNVAHASFQLDSLMSAALISSNPDMLKVLRKLFEKSPRQLRNTTTSSRGSGRGDDVVLTPQQARGDAGGGRSNASVCERCECYH